MQIDTSSVVDLELINPLPGGPPQGKREGTLYRWLNRTKTKPGARCFAVRYPYPHLLPTHPQFLSYRTLLFVGCTVR